MSLLQDLRYGVRVLLQSKGWTAVVVLSLALGIGANTALFSAINGLLLRKLSVENPDTLVRLRAVGRNDMSNNSSENGNVTQEGGLPTRATFSYPIIEELRRANQTMTELVAGAPIGSVNVVVDGRAEIASAYVATGNVHGLLGVRAVYGRTLTPGDDQPSATPVAAISDAFWTRRFGRDSGVVGKVVQVNNIPITIVGVLAPEFTGIMRVIGTAPDLSLPLVLDTQLTGQPGQTPAQARLAQPTWYWLHVMGRLKPGMTLGQVEGNLDGVFQAAARQGMDTYLSGLSAEDRSNSQNQNRTEVPHLRASSGARGIYDNSDAEVRTVTILTAVVGLILLIVCANVANLLLSRAAARQKELSVRLSMGATRPRLVRQLLTESVLLAVLGGTFGVVLAYWGRQLLPGDAGRAPLEWPVLLFAWGLSLLTGVLFGIAPALRATGTNVGAALKENSRALAGSRTLLGKSLLVIQVAISLVLLVGAGLFLRTVENLRNVDVGFNPRNLVLFQVNPQLNRYDAGRIEALYGQMVERVRTIPGVRDVTLSNPALLSGSVNGGSFVVQGRPYTRGPQNNMNRVRIAENFLEMMEIPIIAGRAFTSRDAGLKAPKVAIINEAAVAKFFPGENPIGRRFGSNPETSGEIEVVGIVRDARYNSLRDAPPPTMYVPYTQSPLGAMSFEVRTAGDPAPIIGSIREAARQVDANVPLMNVSTQLEQVERRYGQERVFAQAYAIFGGLALLIASIGLFGLMLYSVTRRTNEIGIRMALGADRADVVRMIMRESLVLVVIGIAIGLGAALAAGRLVATLLYGLAPTDAVSITVATLVMIAVSVLAGYLPARRASRVNPIVALHYE